MSKVTYIKHAKNSKRKNHRVTIPIHALIKNTMHSVIDWSMEGMQIIIKDENDFVVEDTLDIKLILPTGQSSIVLDMKVIIKNIVSNKYGMQISDINEKNRRVLRHYATLAIDGNIDHVDNLSGDLFMTNVVSPIKEPIVMSDIESKTTHTSFLKRLITHGVLGLLFLGVVVVTIVYNYFIVKETTGLISGNSSIYSVPYDGLIKNIYVKKGDHIKKGLALFEMENRDEKKKVKILYENQLLLENQLKSYNDSLKKYQKYADDKLREVKILTKSELRSIKENLVTQTVTYKKAKYLYDKQLLSFVQFSKIESMYYQYKDNYNTIVNGKQSLNQNILTIESNYNKNQDHIIFTKKSILLLSKDIQAEKLEILTLQNYIKSATVLATSTGKIHHIDRQSGEFLNYSENVLIVETKKKPFILTKALSSDMSSIDLGLSCIIESPRTGKLYIAKVTGIGYPAIDGISVSGNELAQSDVPIKIEFNDDSVELHLNEYVKIYMIKNSILANYLVEILTGISLHE